MNQHYACNCGGTGWVNRYEGAVTIECSKCGATASGETKSLARDEWRLKQRRLKKQQDEVEIYDGLKNTNRAC